MILYIGAFCTALTSAAFERVIGDLFMLFYRLLNAASLMCAITAKSSHHMCGNKVRQHFIRFSGVSTTSDNLTVQQ